MSLKWTKLGKTLPTRLTYKRFIPRVDPLVYPQVISPGNSLTAHTANKGLMTSMGHLVFVQTMKLSKSHTTNLTHIGFMTTVGHLVYFQVTSPAKLLTAHITTVGFCHRHGSSCVPSSYTAGRKPYCTHHMGRVYDLCAFSCVSSHH